MTFHYGWQWAIDFRSISKQSLDQPQGLIGLQSNYQVQSSCQPQTAAEEEKRNYLQILYFSIIFRRFIEPIRLFSQQERGQQIDSGADFFAAKWKMVVMGLLRLISFSKTEFRKGRSRILPSQKLTLSLQGAMSYPQGRSWETDSKILLRLSREELRQLSQRVMLWLVESRISIATWEPMQPIPPGMKMFLVI